MAFPNVITTSTTLGIDFPVITAHRGPVANGTANRYWALYDHADSKVHMFKSTNTGTTWAEVDSANAIQLTTNTNTYFVDYNQVYNAPLSKVYVTYWATASPHTLTLRAFDIGTDTWGTTVTGGPALDTSTHDQNFNTPIQACFRGTDTAVFIFTDAMSGSIVGTNGNGLSTTITTYTRDGTANFMYAKCLPEGAGWGLFTNVGTQLSYTVVETNTLSALQSINVPIVPLPFGGGIVSDNDGYIHAFYSYYDLQRSQNDGGYIGTFTQTSKLYHNTISPADVVGTQETLGTVTGSTTNGVNYLQQNQVPIVTTSNVVEAIYLKDPFSLTTDAVPAQYHLLRGTAVSGAVTWDDLNITNVNSDMGDFLAIYLYSLENITGTDYIVYGFFTGTAEGTSIFSYRGSPGIGTAFGSRTDMGTLINSFPNPNCYGLQNPTCIGFGLNDQNPTFGAAYWETCPGTGPPPAGFQIFFMPQYIKRANAPGH